MSEKYLLSYSDIKDLIASHNRWKLAAEESDALWCKLSCRQINKKTLKYYKWKFASMVTEQYRSDYYDLLKTYEEENGTTAD